MTYADDRNYGFSHGSGAVPRASGGMSSTTRYLAGAAYVDQEYAEHVVDELVAHSHRAVAPSIGYDVPTVIRHSFRAQRLWLAQNAVLSAILVLGLALLGAATVTVYVLCLLIFLFVGSRPAGTGRPKWQIVLLVIVVVTVLGCLAGPAVALFGILRDAVSSGQSVDSSAFSAVEPADTGGSAVVTFIVGALGVSLAILATLVWSRYRMITVITTQLGRGRGGGRPRQESREVEHRLAVIDTAQHGNVVLHAGFEPFLGAGNRVNAWSIATELRPVDGEAADDPQYANGNNYGRATIRPPARVRIDPVELVAHLRRRLAALRSHDLPDQERIIGLRLRDQVIASGTRWHDYPLIDDRARLPYSYAEPEAIDAIIRSPQTSARHFLRASVGAPDQPVLGTDGRTIMPAEHQSVVSSTYLHVAVEGGLLYVELVSSLLGPIRQRYLDIDGYDGTADHFLVALREAVGRFGHDTAVAPARLVRAIVRMLSLPGAIHRADRDAAEAPVYDFGARFDVRQAAAREYPANYIQYLDAEKYVKMIDRRATEAIFEFLTAKGVDTSDYAAGVSVHQNNSTTILGSAYGPVATGTGASATMSASTVAAAAAAGKAQGSSS